MGSGVMVVVEPAKRSEANDAAVAHGAPTSDTVKEDALPLCRCDILENSDRRLSMSNKRLSNDFGAATAHILGVYTPWYISLVYIIYYIFCAQTSELCTSLYIQWVGGGRRRMSAIAMSKCFRCSERLNALLFCWFQTFPVPDFRSFSGSASKK